MSKLIRDPELSRLARSINAREKALVGLEGRTLDQCAEWLREAILQGAELNSARARCKHGEWMDWLRVNCPTVHYLKANRYMHLAANLSRERNLTGAETLRQALAICGVPMEATDSKETKQHSPPYVAGLSKFSKFTDYILRNPITDWPSEGVEQLREDLTPVAQQLWPEKF